MIRLLANLVEAELEFWKQNGYIFMQHQLNSCNISDSYLITSLDAWREQKVYQNLQTLLGDYFWQNEANLTPSPVTPHAI